MPIETRMIPRALRTLLLGLGLLSFHCESEREEPTGGETHFLSTCDGDAACGDKLACVCHVCSLPCTALAACAKFPGASCAASPDSCGTSDKICDVRCASDEDCVSFPGAPVCVAGACRGADAAPKKCPASGVTANDVAILGDAFFAATHGITAFLEEEARQSGAISAGERYRDYSNLTANALAFGGNGIASQYESAGAESPVKVVIMTAGGADLLLGSCDTLTADCPLLVDAVAAATNLLARMKTDGVAQVVYAFYPNPQDATLRVKVDVLRPLLQKVCEDSAVPCHWLDLRPAFAGKESAYLLSPGTVPTSEGARVAAAAIWQLMQQACVAQ